MFCVVSKSKTGMLFDFIDNNTKLIIGWTIPSSYELVGE
jgi:hypothetical protein